MNKICINSDATFIGLKILFRKLLEIAKTNCFFLFDNKLYKQYDGLGMGLPQSPLVFADIFMYHEKKNDRPCNCPVISNHVFTVDMLMILLNYSLTNLMQLNFQIIYTYINRQHDKLKFYY